MECKWFIYNVIIVDMRLNSSGESFSFSRWKSTSFSLLIGIRWICACGTSSPSTTTATLLHVIFSPLSALRFALQKHHACQCVVVQVEQVVGLLFRDDQRMAFGERVDVQKCKIAVVFGHFVAGNFTPV